MIRERLPESPDSVARWVSAGEYGVLRMLYENIDSPVHVRQLAEALLPSPISPLINIPPSDFIPHYQRIDYEDNISDVGTRRNNTNWLTHFSDSEARQLIQNVPVAIHKLKKHLKAGYSVYSINRTSLYVLTSTFDEGESIVLEDFYPTPDWVKNKDRSGELVSEFEEARSLKVVSYKNTYILAPSITVIAHYLFTELSYAYLSGIANIDKQVVAANIVNSDGQIEPEDIYTMNKRDLIISPARSGLNRFLKSVNSKFTVAESENEIWLEERNRRQFID